MSDASALLSRRELLVRGSLYGGGLVLALHLPGAARAAATSSGPRVLTPAEWKTVEAVTGRILPTDHEPGAIEAGCVNFIDAALANEDANLVPLYRGGVAALDALARARAEKPFAALAPEAQDALLAALESGDVPGWPVPELAPQVFFETLRVHTVLGFLADPEYGGNRDYAGWKVAGYPGPRHAGGGYTPAQMRGEAVVRAVWGEEL